MQVMRELTMSEVDTVSGGLVTSAEAVGFGVGLLGIGLGIAVAPVGAFGIAAAGAFSFFGGASIGFGGYSLYHRLQTYFNNMRGESKLSPQSRLIL